MIGESNIAERETGPCFLVMQVKNKKAGALRPGHLRRPAALARLQLMAL